MIRLSLPNRVFIIQIDCCSINFYSINIKETFTGAMIGQEKLIEFQKQLKAKRKATGVNLPTQGLWMNSNFLAICRFLDKAVLQ